MRPKKKAKQDAGPSAPRVNYFPFDEGWLDGRMWLQTIPDDATHLRCKWCKKPDTFLCRQASIRDHMKRTDHQAALAGALAFTVRSSGQSGAQEQAARLEQSRREAAMHDPSLATQFCHLHFLLYRGRPMTDFSASPDHLRRLGVPHVAALHWKDGSGWQMAEALSEVVLQRARVSEQAHAANARL